ncbi:MAG: DUF1080 domain-containing protein [Flavobacteriaceae bacterium]|nr:DUF1080 domain-containing protein [Bacteroidia bacterium]NND10299.1 DUF1080 domain-containing protein [Flavobacteriaceae bacterium]NNL60666.1 DUF1080 domain-containing protein [Flavobacteriaceae bacterium]
MKKIVMVLIAMSLLNCKKDKEQTKTIEKEQTKTEQTEQAKTEVEATTKETWPTKDWVSLFDGTSMDNWRGYGTETMHPEWTIEGDAMAFTPSKEGGKNIISKNKYINFRLSLEWKISENGNSGIFWGVHEDEKYSEAYQTGPEIQVLDNNGHPDAKFPTHRAGSLYDMIECPGEHVNPAGEWNWVVLEVNHDTNLGKVTMNGKEVMTFPVHGEAWDEMVENSKFKGWEGFGNYRTGHIGLQDHSDKVWYKNIKIKEL